MASKSSHSPRRARSGKSSRMGQPRSGRSRRATSANRAPQPIDSSDREQAEGHGNQRALMSRAQDQVGSQSGAEGLVAGQQAQPIEVDPPLMERHPDSLGVILTEATDRYEAAIRSGVDRFFFNLRTRLGEV